AKRWASSFGRFHAGAKLNAKAPRVGYAACAARANMKAATSGRDNIAGRHRSGTQRARYFPAPARALMAWGRGHRVQEGGRHLSTGPVLGLDQGSESRQHRGPAGAQRELE